MKYYSTGQLRTLAEFFGTVAAGWFSGGIIAPFFSRVSFPQNLAFFAVGLILSYATLFLALQFTKEVE